MDVNDAKKLFDELRAKGMDDEEILGRLYMMFIKDDIDIDELEALCDVLGYKFTEEFKNMSLEDQKTKGWAETDEAIDMGSELVLIHEGKKGSKLYYAIIDGTYWGVRVTAGKIKDQYMFGKFDSLEAFKKYITKKYPEYLLRTPTKEDEKVYHNLSSFIG